MLHATVIPQWDVTQQLTPRGQDVVFTDNFLNSVLKNTGQINKEGTTGGEIFSYSFLRSTSTPFQVSLSLSFSHTARSCKWKFSPSIG